MTFGTTKLGGIPLDQKEQLSSCVKLLLLWVAASDGNVDEAELEFASSKFPETSGAITTADMLTIIRRADLASLETAIRTVGQESRELRSAFLDMAITMSMADRRIAISENHILRFYADALYLGIGMLEKRFQVITGAPFTEPGDPSDPAWWDQLPADEQAAADRPEEGSDDSTAQPQPVAHGGARMSLDQARHILGVEADATPADIEQAYEGLAAIFHAGRVGAMGEAAISVAKTRREKIEQAYELLRS
jgi:uncharacterized tellurite resistance protein B-like protein